MPGPGPLRGLGAGIVIGRREGYRIWDVDGRSSRHPPQRRGVQPRPPQPSGHRILTEALDDLDIGNHHFPSAERALLAGRAGRAHPRLHYAVFASGGGEAIDLAIKSARRATGRRRIVSVTGAYHGHTGPGPGRR